MTQAAPTRLIGINHVALEVGDLELRGRARDAAREEIRERGLG